MRALPADVQVAESTIELIQLLENEFSIEVSSERVEAFERAAKIFACEKFGSIEGLLGSIASDAITPDVWAQLLHLATNHETRFFRHPASMEMVVMACRGLRSPKIVSVGCSYGEEAYSIAAALLKDGHAGFEVWGVDISLPCIERACTGIYKAHPGVDSTLAVNVDGGKVRIHKWIRDMVSFRVHNILSATPLPVLQPDVVITQNMLIYYRTETRHEILNRLANELTEGGYLITGPAEDANWCNPQMRRIPYAHATVFKKDRT